VLLALAGWIFVFVTAGKELILFGVGTLVAGAALFFLWAWRTGRWPFRPTRAA